MDIAPALFSRELELGSRRSYLDIVGNRLTISQKRPKSGPITAALDGFFASHREAIQADLSRRSYAEVTAFAENIAYVVAKTDAHSPRYYVPEGVVQKRLYQCAERLMRIGLLVCEIFASVILVRYLPTAWNRFFITCSRTSCWAEDYLAMGALTFITAGLALRLLRQVPHIVRSYRWRLTHKKVEPQTVLSALGELVVPLLREKGQASAVARSIPNTTDIQRRGQDLANVDVDSPFSSSRSMEGRLVFRNMLAQRDLMQREGYYVVTVAGGPDYSSFVDTITAFGQALHPSRNWSQFRDLTGDALGLCPGESAGNAIEPVKALMSALLRHSENPLVYASFNPSAQQTSSGWGVWGEFVIRALWKSYSVSEASQKRIHTALRQLTTRGYLGQSCRDTMRFGLRRSVTTTYAVGLPADMMAGADSQPLKHLSAKDSRDNLTKTMLLWGRHWDCPTSHDATLVGWRLSPESGVKVYAFDSFSKDEMALRQKIVAELVQAVVKDLKPLSGPTALLTYDVSRRQALLIEKLRARQDSKEEGKDDPNRKLILEQCAEIQKLLG